MSEDRFLLARYWLDVSGQDLIVAEEYATRLPNVACFHAQQGAEKALKAAITTVYGDAPRTCVARELIEALTAAGLDVPQDVVDAAFGLDKYYAPTRYPDALGGASPATAFTAGDSTSAASAAQTVAIWCSRFLTNDVGAAGA